MTEEEGYFGEEPYGVGVRLEDKAFLAELNRVLNEMKADGTAAEISKNGLGRILLSRNRLGEKEDRK